MSQFSMVLIWAWLMASSFVVSGHMVMYASPIATSGMRFLMALVLMLPALLIYWRRESSDRFVVQFRKLFCDSQRVFHYLIISGSLVGFFICLFSALKSTTPLNTSVLYTLVPLIGVLIARVWLGEAMPLLRMLGFVIGSMGAILVLFATQGGGHFRWHQGDIIFLGGCILLALHVVATQRWGRKLGALPGAFMMMFFGMLWLLPITLVWGDLSTVQWLSYGFWSNILYLTVFTTMGTFLLQQKVVFVSGASRLLAFSYTIPVWVAFYTAMIQSRLWSLVDLGFISGLLLLLVALFLIDGRNTVRNLPHESNSTAK